MMKIIGVCGHETTIQRQNFRGEWVLQRIEDEDFAAKARIALRDLKSD